VRDGKPGPNTRVKMFVHDVQTNTRVPLEPPPQYTDVYATCLAQAARGHLLPKPKSCGPPAPSSSDGVAIRYAVPVLWMMSRWHMTGHRPGCRCNTGTASQPEDAARRLGRGQRLKQQVVSP